jgi:hypothetical protein
MARVGRLAGALLAETEGRYFMIGDTKRPCDFAAAGFEPIQDRDAVARPYVELRVSGSPKLTPPYLEIPLEGEALARKIAAFLLVERNASVSERLWRILFTESEDDDIDETSVVDAKWLVDIPPRVWNIVRDNVLRCL